MTPLRRVLVVAAVIERNGKVLVSLRRPKGERASLWEFPGGKVEAGEGERAALARELREELGVRASIGEEYARVEHIYPDLQVELALYRCALHAGEEPRDEDEERAPWLRATLAATWPGLSADLGASSIHCLGNSAGVFGAMQMGLDLEAQSVLCLAGTTGFTSRKRGSAFRRGLPRSNLRGVCRFS